MATAEEVTRVPSNSGVAQAADAAKAMRDLAASLSGIAEGLRRAFPVELIEYRCRKCNRLLLLAEPNARLQPKCPRCREPNNFPLAG